jgi:hypothetical protein
MPRRFTFAEAQSLIPRVEPLLRQAIEQKSEYDEASAEMRRFQEHLMMAGGVVVDRERALDLRRRSERATERLKATVAEVQEIGCHIKDLDTGLIDFPTTLRGVEVYLCWKLGEDAIAFWHGVDEGFRGRKPIDQDFLDHHEGDQGDSTD